MLSVCKALAHKLPVGGLGGGVTFSHRTAAATLEPGPSPNLSGHLSVQGAGVEGPVPPELLREMERMDWGTGLGEMGHLSQ